MGFEFRRLWAAYAISTYGTWLGFGAMSIVATDVLDAGPWQLAVLSSVSLAAGALLAVPLGPWIDACAKRRVMIAADLLRCAALVSVPIAVALGVLTFAHLAVVAVVLAAAKIGFAAASGTFLKAIVPQDRILVATSRFESTTWSAAIVGPPLGGAAIGLLGPAATIVLDAVSYLASAVGIVAIERDERAAPLRMRPNVVAGWRDIVVDTDMRRLLLNTALVNGLIMATEPLLAVRMLAELRFPPYQYGLAFAVPCIGGMLGSRLARPIALRLGERKVLRGFGAARACWLLGLTFLQPGIVGLVVVIATELGLIFCASVFGPVAAAYRLNRSSGANMLAAWSITTALVTATLTLVWGVLAHVTSTTRRLWLRAS